MTGAIDPRILASGSGIPRARVVLLGASNLTRAFPLVVGELRARRTGPLEILCAHGRGRSYGTSSRFLGRELPGILECGLWRALERRDSARIDALLTDIGNDIMYGAEVTTILGWIDQCLARLAVRGARIAVARLPLAAIQQLSRAHFEIVRAIFFPTRRIEFDVVLERASELDLRLSALAKERGAALIEPASDWYGLDPIHIRRTARREAWAHMLSTCEVAAATSTRARLSLGDRIDLLRCRPEQLRLFGMGFRAEQPSASLQDGTTIALF
jgi:hypothetical protein